MDIVPINVQTLSGYVDDLVQCYCRIWQAPPWNEDFDEGDVTETISRVVTKDAFLGFLADNGGRVIAFTWGFKVNLMEMRKISSGSQLDSLFDDGQKVFYLSELAVDPSCRRRGLGENLSCRLVERVQYLGIPQIVLRTNVAAEAARGLYKKLGFVCLKVIDGCHKDRDFLIKRV